MEVSRGILSTLRGAHYATHAHTNFHSVRSRGRRLIAVHLPTRALTFSINELTSVRVNLVPILFRLSHPLQSSEKR